MKKFKNLFWFLLLSSCATTHDFVRVAPKTPATPRPHDCFKMIAEGNEEAFLEKLPLCRVYRNEHGISSLMFSIYKNQEKIFRQLLEVENANDVDQTGDSALFYAVVSGRTTMIESLRGIGAEIRLNSTGVSPLWVALQNSESEVVFALSPTAQEVNIKGADGWTALHFAIRRKEEKVLDFILKSGAETKIQDSEGKSPLEFARDEVKWDYAVKLLNAL